MEEPPQRLAAGPHPLLSVRAGFRQRLITQMYFPGDPLFGQDPIFNSVRDPKARQRMISAFDLETTEPEWALAYRFDIVLRGRDATPMESTTRWRCLQPPLRLSVPSSTSPCPSPERSARSSPDDPDAVRIAGTVYDGAGEPVTDAMVEVWQANRCRPLRDPEDDRDDLPLEEGFTGFGRCRRAAMAATSS